MKHVVMWSGGITSWATARTVINRHGRDAVTLLFADTNAEDDDLHRFTRDALDELGMNLVRVADEKERDPWQLFVDVRFLGNSQIAPCSHILKQEPCRQWLKANTDPDDTTLYVGLDWSEPHRVPGVVRNWLPWRAECPLTEPPYRDKTQWIAEARRVGLTPPRMYDLGFAHNNCGGACVRGGQAQWARVLEVFPDRYARAEAAEQKMRDMLGKDVSILKSRVGGETKPLTLTALRTHIENGKADQPDLFDNLDWGGCGCFTSEEIAS